MIDIKRVAQILMMKLSFVNWDRCCINDSRYDIYGWIDRPNDQYKDFIVLTVDNNGGVGYITSSALKDEEIAKNVYGFNAPTIPCQRVEHVFSKEIPNVIRLDE